MSITRDQFALQMDRLIDTWGEKPFSAQREHLIWEAVDGLPYAQVIRIVDEFISTKDRPPLPKDFFELAAGANRDVRRYALGEIQPEEIAKCRDCGDSGFVCISRRMQFEQWAKWPTGYIGCHCLRGKLAVEAAARMKSPTYFQQFHEGWRTSYSISPAYPTRLGVA